MSEPPADGRNAADRMDRLLTIMARLRDPQGGCPWDLEQTFASIAPYTIEEAYEVADAIERDHPDDLKDELGDLLLQVVFHARMAEEARRFDFADVVSAIADKMVRRHPHVFGDATIASSTAQSRAWEAQKDRERREKSAVAVDTASCHGSPHASVLDGIPHALPALMRAQKVQKRVATVGFDWRDLRPVLAKIYEELDEITAEIDAGAERERVEDEVGDLLFACVNLARKTDLDAEHALRRATGKFEARFREIERLAAERGLILAEMSLEDLEGLWCEAKAREVEETAPPATGARP